MQLNVDINKEFSNTLPTQISLATDSCTSTKGRNGPSYRLRLCQVIKNSNIEIFLVFLIGICHA